MRAGEQNPPSPVQWDTERGRSWCAGHESRALHEPPRNAGTADTLLGLWPTIYSHMEERGALLKVHFAVHCQVSNVAELGGNDLSFWMQQTDQRVVILLAFVGKRRANDAPVETLLKTLHTGLSHDLQSSMRGYPGREARSSWWSRT